MITEKLSFFLAISLVCCKAVDGGSRRPTPDATTIFNMKLFKILLEDVPGNVVVSPTSIYTSLAMLQQGARGISRFQLNRVLGADSSQSRKRYMDIVRSLKNVSNSSLEFANKAFIKTGFEVVPHYNKTLAQYFLTDIESLDFADAARAAGRINTWATEQTRGRVTQLVTPDLITSDQRLVLLNAMYFKGVWADPFSLNLTSVAKFTTSPGAEVNVSMMSHSARLPAGENRSMGFKWLQLPFRGRRFVMLVVLPNRRHGLNQLIKRFSARTLRNLFRTKQIMDVDIRLPRFKLGSRLQAIPALRKMGLRTVFGRLANLKGIAEQPLFVSQVIHKAEIEVDESGATASAASGVAGAMLTSAGSPPKLTVHADHPFAVFLIDQKNKLPLFTARVTNPSKS